MISPLTFGPTKSRVKKSNRNERMAKSNPREMVLSVPYCDRTEVSKEINAWGSSEGYW